MHPNNLFFIGLMAQSDWKNIILNLKEIKFQLDRKGWCIPEIKHVSDSNKTYTHAQFVYVYICFTSYKLHLKKKRKVLYWHGSMKNL